MKYKRHIKRNEKIFNIVMFIVLCLCSVIMIYPLLWMMSTSVKEQQHVYNTGLIPISWKWDNYIKIWTTVPLARGFLNSVIMTFPPVIAHIFFSALAAFAFAKMNFKGKNAAFYALFASSIIPYAVIMLPQYVMFKKMGLLQGPLAVILPKCFGGAMMIFFFRQYLVSIPDSLIESAKIDGAHYVTIFWKIIFALMIPALVTQFILSFIGNWNDYLGPLLFVRNREWYPVPVVIANFNAGLTAADNLVPLLMAASLLSMLPIMILFAIFQKKIINSVIISGMK